MNCQQHCVLRTAGIEFGAAAAPRLLGEARAVRRAVSSIKASALALLSLISHGFCPTRPDQPILLTPITWAFRFPESCLFLPSPRGAPPQPRSSTQRRPKPIFSFWLLAAALASSGWGVE